MQTNYNQTWNNQSQQRNNYRGAQQQVASTEQTVMYMKMCKERAITPKDIVKMSRSDASKLIQEVISANFATANQKENIKEVVLRLQEYGDKCPMPTDEWFELLKRDRASEALNNLWERERQFEHMRPVDEADVKALVDMQYLPDINFENITKQDGFTTVTIERSILLYEDDACTKPMLTEKGVHMRRVLTPTEFADQIREKLSSFDAKQLLRANRASYYSWRNTRASESKKRLIRTLEGRLANMQQPPVIAQQMDGTFDLMTLYSDSKAELDAPVGYDGMDEATLNTLSNDEASAWIDRLQYEIEAKELYSLEYDEPESRTMEHTRVLDDEGRQVVDELQYEVSELKKLSDLMYALEAISGYRNDDIHEAVNERIFTMKGSEEEKKQTGAVRSYMLYLIDEDFITLENMVRMCDNCETARNILLGLF